MNAVAEQSAKGNDVAMYGIPCFCGTCLDAASAEVTLAFVYDDFFTLVCNGTAAASLDADTTLNAVLLTPFHLNATLDAQVIFFGLQAVVLTAGDTKLELMGQFPCKVPFVQFLCQCVRIDTAAGTDCLALVPHRPLPVPP